MVEHKCEICGVCQQLQNGKKLAVNIQLKSLNLYLLV